MPHALERVFCLLTHGLGGIIRLHSLEGPMELPGETGPKFRGSGSRNDLIQVVEANPR